MCCFEGHETCIAINVFRDYQVFFINALMVGNYLRNAYYFSDVRSINYVGSHAKLGNTFGVHANFDSDPM